MTDQTLSAAAPAAARPAWLGWVVALTSTVCFSVAPPIARMLYALGLDPNTMLFYRFWIALAVLGGFVLGTAPRRLRLARRPALIALGGGLATGVSMLTYFWSMTRLPASIASMTFSLYPLMVLGLLRLRGEPLTYRHLVRLALGLSGVYLLIGPDSGVDWLGVGLVVLSILASSVQSVFVQWYLRDADGLSVTLYMIAGIQIVVAGFWWSQGAVTAVPGWPAWLGIAALAVVSTVASRVLWFAAILHLGSGQVALLVPLETLLTVIWSFLFLGERFTPWQAVGGALILFSALLASQRLLRARWLPPLARGR